MASGNTYTSNSPVKHAIGRACSQQGAPAACCSTLFLSEPKAGGGPQKGHAYTGPGRGHTYEPAKSIDAQIDDVIRGSANMNCKKCR
jgi:hypothetical protein